MSYRILATDRDNEEQTKVARRLERVWGNKLHAYPYKHPVDYYVVRDGDLEGVVEIKCRKIRPDQYLDLILSLFKWTAVREQAHALHVPAILAVRFGDDTIWTGDLAEIDVIHCRQGGRCDRDALHDRELCIHLLISDLIPLTG